MTLAIIAGVWLTCTFSTSACEGQCFGSLCRVLPLSSCGKNDAGPSGTSATPTTSSGAMSTGGARFSSDTVAIQEKLPSQHTDKKRETRRENEGWMSGYSSRVPRAVCEFIYGTGAHWCTPFAELRPKKNLRDSETKYNALQNGIFNQDF